MGEKREKEFAPVKYYRFPAGVCGGEIRVNIPATASKSDVLQMAKNRYLKPYVMNICPTIYQF